MIDYPWTQPTWQRMAAVEGMHHGLLVSGVSGIAKREFAMALAQFLLCAQPKNGVACRQCRQCVLFAAATHPDFHVLITELERRDGRIALAAKYCERYQDSAAREKRANPGRVIAVEQVRLLAERFHTHPHLAARKVALLMPAERMTASAANALLKLLEEPPANSILILVSAHPGYLPATVRSRCLQIVMTPPRAEAAVAWLRTQSGAAMSTEAASAALALAGGGPLDALKLHADGFLPRAAQLADDMAKLASGRLGALELAARFAKQDFTQALEWLHRFCCDLIRQQVTAAPPNPRLGQPAAALPAEAMFALYDKVGRYRKLAGEPLNEQLALDELALALRRLLRGA